MCVSSPSSPPPPTPPPPIAQPSDPAIQQAVEAERRRQLAARYQTLLTGGQGVANTNPGGAPKSLVGT